MTDCTGIAASWCPVHGDCTCPRDGDGVIEWHFEAGYVSFHGFAAWDETAKTVTHYDDVCPIHGDESDHALARVRALTLELRAPADARARRLLIAERRELHARLGWRSR